MKFKSLLTGAAALGIVSAAQAQTQIDITGATAFRGAAHSAIKAAFDAGNGGVSYRFAVDGTSLNGSNAAIFEGNFPGITGTTTIRTSFTGSVEGILSLTKPTVVANQVVYLNTGAFGATTASSTPSVTTNATSKDAASQTSKFAFSDVLQASTPSKTPKLFGAQVGAIVFTPLINKGADAAITNITTQQFRQLALAGRLPTRFFTGLDRASSAADTFVYLTGRNDLSGTRTAFLAEIGYGISAPVKQYVVRASDSTTITQISLAPTAAVTASANLTGSTGIQASSVFTSAGTKEGNGGYNSGSYIRAFMNKTSNATSVVNSSTLSQVSAAAPINLVSWIGTGDAVTAMSINATTGVAAGASNLSYNGEKLDLKWQATVGGNYSTGLSPADRAKVRNGKYTAWSFQNLYYKGQTATPTGNDLVFFNEIRNRLTPTVVGSSGLAMSEMKIPLDPTASPLAPSSTDAAKRITDGGIVAP
jgi:hypothetical protein